MSEIRKPISTLVVRSLIGEATPTEIMQLEEWASLSVDNRVWLDRFDDPDFIIDGINELEALDLDACERDFQRRLHIYEHRAKVKRMKRQIVIWSAAAIILLSCGIWLHKHLAPDTTPSLTHLHTTPAKTKPVNKPEAKAAKQSPLPISVHNDNTHQKQVRTPSAAPIIYEAGYESPPVTAANVPEAFRQLPSASAAPPQPITNHYASRNGPFNFPQKALEPFDILNDDSSILKDHMLPDGSIVTLNAQSRIFYPNPFQGANRKIKLTGEGHFIVVQNDSLPFIVSANGARVEAIGSSSFNMRCYPDEEQTEITLLTGDSLLVAVGPYHSILQPGQTARFSKGSPINKYNTNNRDKVVAYTNRLFHFDKDDLNQVAQEIARWYGLTLMGVNLSHTQVSFQGLRTKSAEAVIKQLTTSDGKSHVKIEGKRLIVH
ncbi:FecR family protein [Longitalea luteola]|uniref:FecR family protein n=1 Tax=Longitalea luteola TaxID=2812563 RepID=UPI001A95AF76|nr:FecR family protein [Longitalea luteola]